MKSDTTIDWDAKAFKEFLVRLLQLFLTLALLVGVAVGLAYLLDKIDIVRKMADVFAPYASSLPWLLVLLTVALALCIPGAPTALLAILKRVKKAGPIEMFPSEDPDDRADELLSIRPTVLDCGSETAVVCDSHTKFSDKAKSTLVESLTPEQRKALFKRLHDNRRRKDNILCLHAGKIGAIIDARNIRLKWSPVHFDASLVRDSERFLVRVVDAYSDDFHNIVDELSDLAERIQRVSDSHARIHVLAFEKASRKTTDAKEERRQAEFKDRQHLQFFFFFVDENDAIKTMEESR